MNTVTVHVRAGQVADRRMFSPPARSRRRTQPAIIEVEFGPACPADTTAKDHRNLAQVLGSSQTFRDYQRAFGEVTGLPLTLRPVIAWQLAHQGGRHQNAFCALIAQANRCCSDCLQMQQRVCEGATGAAKIRRILDTYRSVPPTTFGGVAVTKFQDFGREPVRDADGDPIPGSDFYIVTLANGWSFAARGSGTEPKMKFYVFAQAPVTDAAALPAVKAKVKGELERIKNLVEADARTRAEG